MKKSLLILLVLLLCIFSVSAESATLRLRAFIPEKITYTYLVDTGTIRIIN